MLEGHMRCRPTGTPEMIRKIDTKLNFSWLFALSV
jgi:hypothetical protein